MPRWLDRACELVRRTVDVILPPACLGCDESGHGLWCPRCAGTMPPELPGSLSVGGVPLFGAFPYAPPVSDAVQRLKYGGRTDLAVRLGRLMAARVTQDAAPNLVVPVPLHRRRLAARGFNQSALLARAVARELDAACEPRILFRQKDTPQQAGQDRAQRLSNLRGAFGVRCPSAVALRRVLLVDDVVTTGATMSGCIDVLRSAGADVVGVSSLCVALRASGQKAGA
jgi:ComF family protein